MSEVSVKRLILTTISDATTDLGIIENEIADVADVEARKYNATVVASDITDAVNNDDGGVKTDVILDVAFKGNKVQINDDFLEKFGMDVDSAIYKTKNMSIEKCRLDKDVTSAYNNKFIEEATAHLFEDLTDDKVTNDDKLSIDETIKLLSELTDNFKKTRGDIFTGWRNEKDIAREELRKRYKYVSVSDARMSADEDMCWCISYSTPKKLEEATVPATLTPEMRNNPDSLDLGKMIRNRAKSEDERLAKEAEEKRKEAFRNEHKEIFDKIKTVKPVEAIQILFDEFVPDEGKSDTLIGEIARACMRILYRDYNDGDRFFAGYGIETCGGSASFLASQDESIESELIRIAENNLKEDRYTEAIENKLCQVVVNWIMNNPECFVESAQDSRDFDYIAWEEYAPVAEIEVSDGNFSNECIDYINEYGDIINYSMQNMLDDLEYDFRDDYRIIAMDSPFRDCLILKCEEDSEEDIIRELNGWFDSKYNELVDECGENPGENEEYEDDDDEDTELEESLSNSDNDNIIWSSEPDWVWSMSLGDLKEYFDGLDDGDIQILIDNGDTDKLQSIVYNDEYLRDDIENDLKMIAFELYNKSHDGKVWLVGNYQRWDGGHQAFKYVDDIQEGIFDICYPDYDAKTLLIDNGGDLCFTEYSHDAPMGGTLMKFYVVADNNALSDDDLYDADDFDAVKQWIKDGVLVPIKASEF